MARLIEMRPQSMPASILWIGFAALVAVASAEADYRIDVYGLRGENGPLPLRKIDSRDALAMINNPKPLREKDKFFSFDIGNMMVGGQLGNRRDKFEFGDMIIAHCNINPPHEDMWVECVVEDTEGRVIDSSGQFVTRDQLFANFNYDAANKLVPGEYWMVLKSSGNEVARRPFTFNGNPPAASAMNEFATN